MGLDVNKALGAILCPGKISALTGRDRCAFDVIVQAV